MAQERFWEYRDDDLTIRLDNWLLGIYLPGRYVGFDFNPSNDLNLSLDHQKTGVVYNDINNTPKPKVGVWVSNTGVLVKEDSSISLSISANNSDDDRYDFIYAEHEYLDGTVGGTQASYGVIQGTSSLPVITNPNTQTLIGVLIIPSGATDLSNSRFLPSKPPIPTGKNWRDINPGRGQIVLSNNSRLSTITQEDSLTDYMITTSNIISGNHEIIIDLGPDISDQVGNEYKFIVQSVLLSGDTNLILKYDGLQIASFDDNDLLGSTGGIMFTIRVSETGVFLSDISRSSDFSTGRVNRSALAPINASESITTSLSSTSNVVEINEKEFPSYVVVNSRVINSISNNIKTEPEVGTEIILEAGNINGLKIEFPDFFGRPVGQKIIVSGSLGAQDAGIFNGSGSGPDEGFTIPQGHIVKLVYTSTGVWCVTNDSYSTRISGVENILSDIRDIQNTLRRFSVRTRSNSVINFDNNGFSNANLGSLNVSLQGHLMNGNSFHQMPSDGVDRIFFMMSTTSWNRKTTSGSGIIGRVRIAHVTNSGSVSYSSTGLTEYVESGEFERNYDDTIAIHDVISHDGDGGFAAVVIEAFGDQYDIFGDFSIIGIPRAIINNSNL